MVGKYAPLYHRWNQDPAGFWQEAATAIDWFEEADCVFDPNAGVYGRWFTGAQCNTAYNCLDRHISAGRGDQAALIYDSPVTTPIRKPFIPIMTFLPGSAMLRPPCKNSASRKATG